MLLDVLITLPGSELLERTSSSLRVQQVVQLSLAPAFLLAGIGAVMNVMTNRLIWVANKIERILDAGEDPKPATAAGAALDIDAEDAAQTPGPADRGGPGVARRSCGSRPVRRRSTGPASRVRSG